MYPSDFFLASFFVVKKFLPFLKTIFDFGNLIKLLPSFISFERSKISFFLEKLW